MGFVSAVSFDVFSHRYETLTQRGVSTHFFFGEVHTPFVRHDPPDTGFDGGIDELCLALWCCCSGHRDDQNILALQCLDKRGVVAILDSLDVMQSGRHGTRTLWSGDGCDAMFLRLNQGISDRAARPPTGTNDRNVFHIVSEALGLVVYR